MSVPNSPALDIKPANPAPAVFGYSVVRTVSISTAVAQCLQRATDQLAYGGRGRGLR